MTPEIEKFIEEYAEELVLGHAVYFIGAGVSIDSKLPSWNGLIKPFTDKLGVKLEGKDMPLMAQYVINEEAGNRGPLVNAISRRLRRNFSPNAKHESIAKTNLKTIWTTNYDNLIEKAFTNTIIDVKVNDDAIAREMPETQLEIIKMHGCIFNSNRDDIIITQADYEDFFLNRPATSHRLKMDLLQKAFLFIGYGYGDPNIKNIITEARRLSGNSTRQHYLIAKKKEDDDNFEFWCMNLRRYGIRVIKIDEYGELDLILEALSLKSRGKSVFITGSHDNKNSPEAEKLGKALALEEGFILNDGQSAGVMRIVSKVFMETIIESKIEINKRLRFFPNPYAANPKFANDPSLLYLLKQWRVPLFRSTHVMIAFDGGMGTIAEIEVALDMGCVVIPFFTNKEKNTWSLMNNKLISDRLNQYDSQYLQLLKKRKISYKEVIALVKVILN